LLDSLKVYRVFLFGRGTRNMFLMRHHRRTQWTHQKNNYSSTIMKLYQKPN